MTAREFAAKIKKPYPTVATWLRKGKVKGAEAHTLGAVTVWLIPVETANGFKDYPKRGRPKKATKKQASKKVSESGKSKSK